MSEEKSGRYDASRRRSGGPSDPSRKGVSAVPAPAANAAHTPGPWHVFPSSYAALHVSSVEINDERGLTVAYARNFVEQFKPQSEANARLIAAAPDLLVALITASELVGDAFHGKVGAAQALDAIDDVAKAAIAKARGASS